MKKLGWIVLPEAIRYLEQETGKSGDEASPIPGSQEEEEYYQDQLFRIEKQKILEALNTDLVCDAINTAMRELFLQIVYGRTQSAFSEGGLPIGAGLEDLGKGTRSQTGTIYSTLSKGPRYLELAEGYITEIGLDEDNQIIGYKYINMGKMMDNIKAGIEPMQAIEKASGQYGRFNEAVKVIDPRKE